MLLAWLASQAVATANLKRESREHFQKSEEEYVERLYKEAKEQDFYWNASIRRPDYNFYSDGSLRWDRVTDEVYPKGMYFANCYGYGAGCRKMPEGTKCAPRTKK